MSEGIVWLERPLKTAAGEAHVIVGRIENTTEDGILTIPVEHGGALFVKASAVLACNDAGEFLWVVDGVEGVVDVRFDNQPIFDDAPAIT